jgi:hypothetical protein
VLAMGEKVLFLQILPEVSHQQGWGMLLIMWKHELIFSASDYLHWLMLVLEKNSDCCSVGFTLVIGSPGNFFLQTEMAPWLYDQSLQTTTSLWVSLDTCRDHLGTMDCQPPSTHIQFPHISWTWICSGHSKIWVRNTKIKHYPANTHLYFYNCTRQN